jgi:hypothetical protein
MTNIHVDGTAAQLPPATTKAAADFNDAIRDARCALHNEPLDRPTIRLGQAIRITDEARNPHACELANLAKALAPAFENVTCFLDMVAEQSTGPPARTSDFNKQSGT